MGIFRFGSPFSSHGLVALLLDFIFFGLSQGKGTGRQDGPALPPVIEFGFPFPGSVLAACGEHRGESDTTLFSSSLLPVGHKTFSRSVNILLVPCRAQLRAK